MSLRPRRQNIVIWSSSAVPVSTSGDLRRSTRPSRVRRIRWWLRTGALLMIIGMLRLARTTRACWEPVSLLAGLLLTTAGLMMPAVGPFLLGLLVLIVTLLRGIREQRRDVA